MENKFAVAGYDRDKQKLAVKVLDLDGVVDLLKSCKHYGYEPEQLEKLKKDLVNPKGYYVDFKTMQFRVLKI